MSRDSNSRHYFALQAMFFFQAMTLKFIGTGRHHSSHNISIFANVSSRWHVLDQIEYFLMATPCSPKVQYLSDFIVGHEKKIILAPETLCIKRSFNYDLPRILNVY